jgi:hypothetical protein
MTTTLRFPQDLLRLLYWTYFKPFTLRRYVKSLDDRLDEDLKLWEAKDKLAEKPALRELAKLEWTLALAAPPVLLALVIFVLLTASVKISFVRLILFSLGCLAGTFVGRWIRWRGTKRLERAGWVLLACILLIGILYTGVRAANPALWKMLVQETARIFGGLNIYNLLQPLALGVGVGVVLGVALDVTLGVALDVAAGVGVGIASGVALNVAGGVAGGVASGMAGDVAVGVAGGVAVGVAGGVSFIASDFRLFIYIFELPLELLLSWLADRRPQQAATYWRFAPVRWDETIWLPLIGLPEHLIAIGKHGEHIEAQEAIALVAGSARQGWAAQEALVELTALEMEQVADARGLAGVAEHMAWLPADLSQEVEALLPPVREIAQRAQAALESNTLVNRFEQLQRAQAELNNLRQGLGSGRAARHAARFAGPLAAWQDLLKRELDTLRASINALPIPPVYVVGVPLILESKVFKGRRDVFVMLERELTGIAESRPSLLLYGARRSGKTSVLRQLPARLGPDYVPVEIDLQSGATASGPTGLMGYIAGRIVDNAVNFRRVRLPALKPAALEADPYLAFLNWLGEAEKTLGSKKILLNLDEYERLQEMVLDGRLDQRVFNWCAG